MKPKQLSGFFLEYLQQHIRLAGLIHTFSLISSHTLLNVSYLRTNRLCSHVCTDIPAVNPGKLLTFVLIMVFLRPLYLLITVKYYNHWLSPNIVSLFMFKTACIQEIDRFMANCPSRPTTDYMPGPIITRLLSGLSHLTTL
jgi:hypothetical protein